MKNSIKLLVALYIIVSVYSCKNDDDSGTKPPEETASIVGNWRLTSGIFITESAQFLVINADNSLVVLSEDALGFRDENRANYSSTDTQITTDFGYGGISIRNYTLTENNLTLIQSSGDTTVFSRETASVDVDGWIQDISVIEEGNAPWESQVDIAFNGTHILFGNGYATNTIGFINTNTFAIDSELITVESAFAVEVEKWTGANRYIFQSDNGFSAYTAYREDTGDLGFTSMEIGSWIYGLASIDSEQIWVASNNNRALYLHNYLVNNIEQTILLDRSVGGLDYQDGYLYVCSNGNVYKCQTSPSFEVVENISLDGYNVYGIAFDGTNFWLHAYPTNGSTNKIIKSSLTL